MATVAPPLPIIERNRVTLEDVAWGTYCALRDAEANDHVRMTYLDGSLTLMSPAYVHDGGSELLGQLIRAVATVQGLTLRGVGSVTMRRPAPGRGKGVGKEADTSFYFGDDERRMRGCRDLDLSIYPPPNLAIEVDNTRDSAASLPIYARLGVPEVWRYSVRERSLWIGRLDGDSYREVARSVALPRLTPALILEALDRYEAGDLDELAWFEWAKDWARALPEA